MATHSSVLAWRIPGTEEPGGLPSHTESDTTKVTQQQQQCRRPGFNPWVRKIPWRREWQPTPVLLLGKIPWTEKSGRLQSMELQRFGHD